MLSTPTLTFRDAIPYIAIRKIVAMNDIPAVLPPLIPQIFEYVSKHGLKQSGPVFFRYLSMDENNVLVADVGVPLAEPTSAQDGVLSDSFPAGNYLMATYTGPYTDLKSAHMALVAYAKENGVKEIGAPMDGGEAAGTRAEFYVTDPAEVEDPQQWITEISFLADK